MAKITQKTRKKMIISGLAALCIVLVISLTAFFSGGNDVPDTPSAKDSGQSDVAVSDITPSSEPTVSVPAADNKPDDKTGTSDPVLDVEKETHEEINLTESEKPKETPAPPKVADESALTNSDKKPSYEENQTKPDNKSNQPKHGDKKDGYIYIDGFGWIKDEGGGAVGEVVDGEGDINKQVGQMD